MKYNDNIYYYLPMKKLRPGGHSSTVFVVKGENTDSNQYLVEGGIGTAGKWADKNLKKMSEDSIDIKKTMGIFPTHAHQDHITGIAFYLNKIGKNNIPTYFMKEWIEVIKDPDYADQYFFNEMGPWRKDLWGPQFILSPIFRIIWGKRSKLNNVVGITEGQKFPLGDKSSIEIVFTPGHAPEHFSPLIHCSDGRKVLLSGDLLSFKENNEGNLNSLASLNNPASIYIEELKTLEKLMKIEIDVLFTSHYGFFEGKDLIYNYVNTALERMIKLKDSVLDELTKKPFTIKKLTKKIITGKHYLSGYAARTSTIFVILKYLINIGKVEGDLKTYTFNLKNN